MDERNRLYERLAPDDGADPRVRRQLSRITKVIRENDAVLVGWLTDKLGDADAAQDVAQDAYVRVWRYAQKTVIDNPRALLFKTAANLAVNEFRARRRRMPNFSLGDDETDEDGVASIPSDEPTPEDVALAQGQVRLSLGVIEALPVKVRRAFVMSRFENKTYSEIAVRLDVSVSSVEKYMITALKALSDAISETRSTDRNVVRFPRRKKGAGSRRSGNPHGRPNKSGEDGS
ncbi:MAG: sigma-70 family RNA polymerase sigma factor [Pseudomonadota bacterium]